MESMIHFICVLLGENRIFPSNPYFHAIRVKLFFVGERIKKKKKREKQTTKYIVLALNVFLIHDKWNNNPDTLESVSHILDKDVSQFHNL